MSPITIQGNKPKGMRYWPLWIRVLILVAAYLLQAILEVLWYFSMLWIVLGCWYRLAPRSFNRVIGPYGKLYWVGRPPPSAEGVEPPYVDRSELR